MSEMPVLFKPVLVTGASGFLGQALVGKLIADGYAVTAVSRHGEVVLPFSLTHVERYEDTAHLMKNHLCIVHLAARVHVMNDKSGDPLSAFRAANAELTMSLARHAAAAGVKRFIFVSSIKVNGEETLPGHAFGADDICTPQDAYGVSKMEAEQGLRKISAETGMEVVIIRPPLVYGPGVRANFAALMKAVQRGIPLPLGAIDNRRSLVALDNLLDFIAVCIRHPDAGRQTFLVSDGDDLSTPELIRRMASALRKPARLVPVPLWILKAGAAMLGQQDRLQRLCSNLQLDISKSRTLLGWQPPFSVDEGLRRAARDFQP